EAERRGCAVGPGGAVRAVLGVSVTVVQVAVERVVNREGVEDVLHAASYARLRGDDGSDSEHGPCGAARDHEIRDSLGGVPVIEQPAGHALPRRRKRGGRGVQYHRMAAVQHLQRDSGDRGHAAAAHGAGGRGQHEILAKDGAYEGRQGDQQRVDKRDDANQITRKRHRHVVVDPCDTLVAGTKTGASVREPADRLCGFAVTTAEQRRVGTRAPMGSHVTPEVWSGRAGGWRV
ncbi:hypothetical protein CAUPRSCDRAFT_12164, partial [Caulochytrium protostelioides]